MATRKVNRSRMEVQGLPVWLPPRNDKDEDESRKERVLTAISIVMGVSLYFWVGCGFR